MQEYVTVDPVMTAVAAEVAVPDPSALVAITVTLILCPTSLSVSIYVDPVAPEIGMQEDPEASHRSHCFANDVGKLDHDPFDAVNA